jgi:hypothetical protein
MIGLMIGLVRAAKCMARAILCVGARHALTLRLQTPDFAPV